ncbi:MAG: alanine racemase [Caulobacterales bacterium 32-69-10]|nr:MAG: alanine racemase [Caulobacterales bacterium 32-69-10]
MTAETRLTIDLDALAANFHVLAREAAGAEVAPVVKADGYGLGAEPVARRLWAEGARSFFVARLSEGEALRAALGDRPATIRVLDGATRGSHARLVAANLTPVLSSAEQVAYWRSVQPGPVSVHVETGMNRLGLSAGDLSGLDDVAFLMSHLSRADQPGHLRNAAQLGRFRAARTLLPGAQASLAASGGIFLGPEYRFDVVRPGISLYGGGPQEVPDPRIRPVAHLDAPILQIRELKAGDAVGYGGMFTADRSMRAAVIGAGYADGVLRAAHAKGAGWLDGVRLPFLIVTMDMIVVDVGEAPTAKVGGRVELLGPNAHLDHLAAAASSVAHEILVRISPRAARRYVGEAKTRGEAA